MAKMKMNSGVSELRGVTGKTIVLRWTVWRGLRIVKPEPKR